MRQLDSFGLLLRNKCKEMEYITQTNRFRRQWRKRNRAYLIDVFYIDLHFNKNDTADTTITT